MHGDFSNTEYDHFSTYGLWGIGLLGTGAGLAFISSCIYACCALRKNPHCVYETRRHSQVSYRNIDILSQLAIFDARLLWTLRPISAMLHLTCNNSTSMEAIRLFHIFFQYATFVPNSQHRTILKDWTLKDKRKGHFDLIITKKKLQ